MKLIDILKRMFVERDCVICGDPISYESEEPICEDCEEDWCKLLTTRCNICGKERELCHCLPKQIKEISNGHAIWCVFYDNEINPKANKIFFDLKKYGYRILVNLIADIIVRALISSCCALDVKYKRYAITYVPRRRVVKHQRMFDQSEKLAKAIGKRLGIPVFSCLENKSWKEQKKLNKHERIENARKAYRMKKNAKLEYEYIFLVDDIITSGSSMRACADLLYENGAINVIPVAFAKDNIKKGE